MALNNLQTNQSPLDRSIRFFFGVSLAVITAPGMPIWEGVYLKYVVFVFALANLFAAVTGWCAGYALFGYSTCKKVSAPPLLTLEEASRFTPDKLATDFLRLRTNVVSGVAALLLVLSIAFSYHQFLQADEAGKLADSNAVRQSLTKVLMSDPLVSPELTIPDA